MNLLGFYKQSVYEHGYYMAKRDGVKKDHENPADDLYFKDEMDYYICAEYLERYGAFTETDEKFLLLLGFVPQDFQRQ